MLFLFGNTVARFLHYYTMYDSVSLHNARVLAFGLHHVP